MTEVWTHHPTGSFLGLDPVSTTSSYNLSYSCSPCIAEICSEHKQRERGGAHGEINDLNQALDNGRESEELLQVEI